MSHAAVGLRSATTSGRENTGSCSSFWRQAGPGPLPLGLGCGLQRPPCWFAWGCPDFKTGAPRRGKPISLRHTGKACHLRVTLVQTGATQEEEADGESLINAVNPLPRPACHPLPDASVPSPCPENIVRQSGHLGGPVPNSRFLTFWPVRNVIFLAKSFDFCRFKRPLLRFSLCLRNQCHRGLSLHL